eukprot:CAMPEP_0180702322 /NCGR_PEP_ID=MMETSP1038_2-20121128/6058_1 /TAXON_ID=632150 /ORGANISM="Azadinium spinosum, Strain 3D9" /LENGTH=197 /DNA_ID=CAMNT_0022734075 /DNA_START=483 /DNA_END=1073 /DNA_ORIENTATION=+
MTAEEAHFPEEVIHLHTLRYRFEVDVLHACDTLRCERGEVLACTAAAAVEGLVRVDVEEPGEAKSPAPSTACSALSTWRACTSTSAMRPQSMPRGEALPGSPVRRVTGDQGDALLLEVAQQAAHLLKLLGVVKIEQHVRKAGAQVPSNEAAQRAASATHCGHYSCSAAVTAVPSALCDLVPRLQSPGSPRHRHAEAA